ncbi:MAG TPA: aldehyde dehydrogenase family protein, partial [Agromyces sp.]|nr:aldehyde dehydrogenase family protein [Agromyces sp.]
MSQTMSGTQAAAAATATVEHWIDGASVAGDSDRTGPVYNPALGVEQKRVRFASTDDVDAAVQAAARAFPGWRDTSIAKRQAVMFTFRELLAARSDELAAILTSEHGKVMSDAAGEIARGLEVVELACAMPGYTKGEYSENVSTGIDVYTTRQPVGVVGIISPFNFPAMVPLWFF